MYDPVDMPQENAPRRHQSWLLLLALFIIGGIFYFVWQSGSPQPDQIEDPTNPQKIRTTYLKALSEPTASLRRARLLDFQQNYPDTPRQSAIRDQLNVINTAELRDWEALTHIIFDVRAAKDAKLAALDTYEKRWNSRLLGGRGQEIETLRASISEVSNAQPLPDRKMEFGDSPIPTDIASDQLAGGPPPAVKKPPPIKAPPPKTATADVIVRPSLRQKVSPRYPRKALRRKIEATVILSLNIDAQGQVVVAELISIEADRYKKDFIKAAERAAMKSRFNPKTINGKAVASQGVKKRYLFRPRRKKSSERGG